MEPTAALSASTLDELCEVRSAALLAAARDYQDWAIRAACARIREAVPTAHRIYIDGCQRPIDRCWIEEIADRGGQAVYRRGEIGMQAQFALDEVNDLLTNAVYSCLPHDLPYYWLRVGCLPGMYMFDLTNGLAVAQDDLTDQDRYIMAADQAVADETNRRGPLADYLTTLCPECDSFPTRGDGRHVLSRDGYVLVGCAGYLVIDPRLVGITVPNWEDWTSTATTATAAAVPDAAEPPGPTSLTNAERAALLSTPVHGDDRGIVVSDDGTARDLSVRGLAQLQTMYRDGPRYRLTAEGWAELDRLTTLNRAGAIRITFTWSETVTYRAAVSLLDLHILLNDGAYGGIDRARDLQPGRLHLDGFLGRAHGALIEELHERKRTIRIQNSTITHVSAEDIYPAPTPADLEGIVPHAPDQPPAGH